MDGTDGLDNSLTEPGSFNNLDEPQVLLRRSKNGRFLTKVL
jgi:hypothetical protein